MVFRHRSRTTTQDVVDPHGMVAAGRSWYLCASHDGEVRFTKFSRIEEVEILAEVCLDDSGSVRMPASSPPSTCVRTSSTTWLARLSATGLTGADALTLRQGGNGPPRETKEALHAQRRATEWCRLTTSRPH
nr:WYL domain-containing protein [Actinomyces sp. ZJ308]